MPLFEVAIIEKPSKKDHEEGMRERLVFGPKFVIAKDPNAAALNAVLENTAEMAKVNRDRMEVLIRPFA